MSFVLWGFYFLAFQDVEEPRAFIDVMNRFLTMDRLERFNRGEYAVLHVRQGDNHFMTLGGSCVLSGGAYQFSLTDGGVSGFLPSDQVQVVPMTEDGATETKIPNIELYFSSSHVSAWRKPIPYADLKEKHKLVLDYGIFVIENTEGKPLQTGIQRITIAALDKSVVFSPVGGNRK